MVSGQDEAVAARGRMVLHAALERRARALAARLVPHLPVSGRALDIGSGTGHNAQAIRALTRLVIEEVDVCDMHVVGGGPALFNGRTLPYPDGCFAVSTILFVLQCADDPAALLREAARVTAGPVVVIQSTCEGTLGDRLLRVRSLALGPFAFRVARRLGFVAGPWASLVPRRRFTRAGFQEVLEQAGLTLEHLEPEPWFGLPVSRDLYVLRRRSARP